MTVILDKDVIEEYDYEVEEIVNSLRKNLDIDVGEEIVLCLE